MPARPYTARLSVLRRLICPSAWPLLQCYTMAFLTASISPLENRAFTSGCDHMSASPYRPEFGWDAPTSDLPGPRHIFSYYLPALIRVTAISH